MDINIQEGLKHVSTKKVELQDTAKFHGSGTLEVFATPAMVALMENAAMLSVAQYLAEGYDTVGILINIEHIKASVIGATITATAILTQIKGRTLTFEVMANDEHGEIGRGKHVRVIIEKNKFLSKISQ